MYDSRQQPSFDKRNTKKDCLAIYCKALFGCLVTGFCAVSTTVLRFPQLRVMSPSLSPLLSDTSFVGMTELESTNWTSPAM